jgi:tetratricopeptide (TPR) repeat protein
MIISGNPFMAEASKNTGSLHDFYQHLGTLVIRGKGMLQEEENAMDWISVLSRSGSPDLANRYENLLLMAGAEDLYRQSLTELISSTGEKLRTSIGLVKNEDELACRVEDMPFASPSGAPRLPGERTEDISYLTHMLGVGSLRQKRMAAEALGNLLLRKKDPSSRDMLEEAASILADSRDPEITFEVTHALSFAPGSEMKKARATLARADLLMQKIHDLVVSYWDGLLEEEPVSHLESSDLVSLGIWMRLASDYVAGHVGEILVDLMGEGNETKLSSTIAVLLYSADPRLLPVFIRILQDGALASKIEAIKAIAHIDDPRSHGALLKAFRHSADEVEKIVLARALARMGSAPHARYLTEALRTEKKPEVLEEALKAVGELESVDESTKAVILGHLGSDNAVIVKAAVRALAGVGQESDIEVLSAVADRNPRMKALVKAATRTLYSHIILRGSDLPARAEMPGETGRVQGRKPGLGARIAAWLLRVLAAFYLVIGKSEKSLAAVARSLERSPRAARSHFLKASVFFTMGAYEKAIETYREAMAIDPSYILKKPDDADRLIRAYLARSRQIDEQTESPEEIFMLMEELDEMDLTRADPNLKIEITRMMDYCKYMRSRARTGGEAQ